jgi:hypothetical protein
VGVRCCKNKNPACTLSVWFQVGTVGSDEAQGPEAEAWGGTHLLWPVLVECATAAVAPGWWTTCARDPWP